MTPCEERFTWLVELAWQGGDRALQRGWWAYAQAELDKLGPGFRDRALAALKERRNEVQPGPNEPRPA